MFSRDSWDSCTLSPCFLDIPAATMLGHDGSQKSFQLMLYFVFSVIMTVLNLGAHLPSIALTKMEKKKEEEEEEESFARSL